MENNPASDLTDELCAARRRIETLTVDLDEAHAEHDRIVRALRDAGAEPVALGHATKLDPQELREIINHR